MRYRILNHSEVENDLDAISRWFFRWASPEAAEERLVQIGKSIEHLRDFPHIGSVRNEIAPGIRAIPTAADGVIAFVVDDDACEVLIVAVTFAGADWIAKTRERLRDDR